MMSSYILFIITFYAVFSKVACRECGLPENLEQLPDFAREEIREIWKNHVPGASCTKELEIENDIIDVIKTFDSGEAVNLSKQVESVISEQNNSNTSGKSKSTQISSPDYEHIGINAGTPIPLMSSFPSSNAKLRSTKDLDNDDYLDQTTFDDVAMMQFDNLNAPFLRTASSEVRREFKNVWEDSNIPSESLRALKIQTLAVSLLSSQQLSEYNRWATKRRRVLKAREQEMRHLSFNAKQALRQLSVQKDDISHISIPIGVKNELTSFVRRLNRRRSLKLLL